jgi:hypothetical protein
MLPFAHWPIEDQRRWEAAFQSGDLFDEKGLGTRLAAATRQLRLESHGRFLGFLSAKHPKLLKRPPEARIDRRILAEYVAWRRRSCGDTSLAADLCSLGGTLKLLCPNNDWTWLKSIANRIATAAPPPARKYNLVASDRLYALGIELMDNAVNVADAVGRAGTRHAIQYRDGLIISILALVAPRGGTLQQFSFWLVETLLIVSLVVARVIAGAQMLSACISAGFSYRSPWHLGHRRPPTMNRTAKMRIAGHACCAANRAASHKSRRSLGTRHTRPGYQDQATAGLFNSEGIVGAH